MTGEAGWFDKTWAMVVALVLFLPLGLLMLWRKPWPKRARAGITAVVVLLFAGVSGAGVYAMRPTGSVVTAGRPIPSALLDAMGTGIRSTRKFGVPRNWDIHFSYDNCPGLDGTGTSIVSVWDARGPVDLAINDLGTGGSDFATEYNGPDTVWLEVNSACSWNITVGSLPSALRPPPTTPPGITSTTTSLPRVTIDASNAPKNARHAHARGRRQPLLASRRHG